MAKSLGEGFLAQALASVSEAGRLLAAGDVPRGLEQLTREELIGGVRRGVEAVARSAGVPALEVYRRLPMQELESQVERLSLHQRRAAERWQELEPAPPAQPVADADPRTPGATLVQLAEMGGRDDVLRKSLIALAADLNDWRGALDRCHGEIATAEDLARRRRRRRLVRLLALGLIPVAVAGGAAWYARLHLIRARVDTMLARGECAAEQIPASDLAHANDAQRAAAQRGIAVCRARREEARRAAEAERAAEAKRQAAERARRAQRARCEHLSKAMADGSLDAAAKETAGRYAPLFERLATGELDLADVELDLADLPCRDTKVTAQVGRAYAQLVAASASRWLPTRTPSAAVRALVVEHRDAVEQDVLANLGAHIDRAASRAVRTGKAEDIARFTALCELTRALELLRLGNCVAVLDLAGDG